MNYIHRIMLSIALIVTALLCYVAGSASGTITFIILGVSLELLFWLNLIPAKRKQV